jgi:PAS domain S-box-containing protein
VQQERTNEAPTAPEERVDHDFGRFADRAADLIYRYRLQPTRGFEYVNPAATRMTGYTPEEHYADPDLGFKLVHPDDRQWLTVLTQVPLGSGPLSLRWIRKDGTVLWTEHSIAPVYDEDGELVAIEGIAREAEDPTQAHEARIRLFRNIRVNLEGQRVYVDGTLVHLTASEFRLLALFTARPGEVLSREEIMKQLWESSHTGSGHAAETHVSALRRKIERDPRFPERIVTVRGRGYRFVADK